MKVHTDLTKIVGKDLAAKWVALSRDRGSVLGSGTSLIELKARLGARAEDAVFTKVLSADMEYAFGAVWHA